MISPPSIREIAEQKIIEHIIKAGIFDSIYVRRRLAAYSRVFPNEKDKLVFEVAGHYWNDVPKNEILTAMRDFDLVFGILDKKSHFIHQFEVFLLGLFIITFIMPLDHKNIISTHFGNSEELLRSWLLTAVGHDFGYPLQLANETAEKFAYLYKKLKLRKLAGKYRELSKNYNINSEDQLNYCKVIDHNKGVEVTINVNDIILDGIAISLKGGSLKMANEIKGVLLNAEEWNHGYVSAIMVCRNYIKYLSNKGWYGKKEEKWRIDILKKITGAIALHAMPFKDVRSYISLISFNHNPLAYLLYVVDQLQEWSREIRPSLKWPTYCLVDIFYHNSDITFDYILEHEKWNGSMKTRVRESLHDKQLMIHLPIKPDPLIGIKININFLTNQGDTSFEPISILF